MGMGCRLVVLGLVALAACGRERAPTDAESDVTDLSLPEQTSQALSVPAGTQGSLHFVRLVARGDRYGFEPNELRIRGGDVVRFVHTDHQPESVAFDAASVPPDIRSFVLDHGFHSGLLLTEPGAFMDVPFVDAPPGEYPFFSIPHRVHGMVGTIVVEEG